MVIHDTHSIASPERLEFCFAKCKDRHDELGHWSHAYVAYDPDTRCNVNCICIKEKAAKWAIALRNESLNICIKSKLAKSYSV